MSFRPLHDRVVIRRLEGEEKTKGGIIIPDTVKEKPSEGVVVAVGPLPVMSAASGCYPRSRLVTASSSASGAAPQSRWRVKTCVS